MTSRQLQNEIKVRLETNFGESVTVEWPISKGATDRFAHENTRYSPRVDVAVYTVGTNVGNYQEEIERFWEQNAPSKLENKFQGLKKNKNPRCALAIEVVYSGSSKHILGDITNASMMGLYGAVVPSQKMLSKTKRIFEYIKAIREAGKAPESLFRNVIVISENEFLNLIS